MLDDNDIKKLIEAQKEVFVTKGEFESFMEIAAKKEDLDNLTAKVDGLASKDDIRNLNKKLDSISEDLKKNIRMETRVADMENVLNMPALKK